MSRRILFLVPYPLHESPSQRFRFEQYFGDLEQNGYTYSVQSFLSSPDWRVVFGPGKIILKLKVFAFGFLKRIFTLFMSLTYDFIFIHREVTPLGPPVFEWILAKILRKRIIYDFDDAIWLTDRKNESWFLKVAKWRGKVAAICKWSYKVSCGNEYLCNYAATYNRNVVHNPTTIDTINLHNPDLFDANRHSDNTIRIGWTGSHSTLKYLQEIETVLQKILTEYSHVDFVVIADKPPPLKNIPSMKFIPWSRETEIDSLQQFDIGIMPLPDDEWSKGKCGFKALQYMALETATIASPVGVNTTIITHGKNGLLCQTTQEWEDALRGCIDNPELRKKLGRNGRQTVLEYYSVLSNTSNFLSLFV